MSGTPKVGGGLQPVWKAPAQPATFYQIPLASDLTVRIGLATRTEVEDPSFYNVVHKHWKREVGLVVSASGAGYVYPKGANHTSCPVHYFGDFEPQIE